MDCLHAQMQLPDGTPALDTSQYSTAQLKRVDAALKQRAAIKQAFAATRCCFTPCQPPPLQELPAVRAAGVQHYSEDADGAEQTRAASATAAERLGNRSRRSALHAYARAELLALSVLQTANTPSHRESRQRRLSCLSPADRPPDPRARAHW